MKKTIARLAAIVGLGLVMEASAGAAEPKAAETFADGQRFAAVGRWDDARIAFEAAWAREHSPETAAALGHAELQLGLPVRAADHLSLALEKMADTDRSRPDVFFDLLEARRLVASLRISARTGATVSVDGNVVGVAPIERVVFVDAGRHAIRVELSGFTPVERSVEAHMGEDVRADFGLVPVTAKPLAPLASEAAPAAASSGKNLWVIGVGVVAGTGTLAVGLGYGVAVLTSHHHVEQRNINAGVFTTVGGALLLATLTYALWPTGAPAARTGLTGTPVVLNGGGGLTVQSSF